MNYYSNYNIVICFLLLLFLCLLSLLLFSCACVGDYASQHCSLRRHIQHALWISTSWCCVNRNVLSSCRRYCPRQRLLQHLWGRAFTMHGTSTGPLIHARPIFATRQLSSYAALAMHCTLKISRVGLDVHAYKCICVWRSDHHGSTIGNLSLTHASKLAIINSAVLMLRESLRRSILCDHQLEPLKLVTLYNIPSCKYCIYAVIFITHVLPKARALRGRVEIPMVRATAIDVRGERFCWFILWKNIKTQLKKYSIFAQLFCII